ncbi:transcription elongation factor GreB [bacterium]|nr:transcription elongation factor GreB [bacterium]
MSKAFTKEDDKQDDDSGDINAPPIPKGSKNYITPQGFKKLKDELHDLLTVKRPELTAIINWAASNGDRSENADYIYGKRRLREVDKRIRFLEKRIEAAEVTDPTQNKSTKVFFGATVTIEDENGEQKTYSIVGIDETDFKKNRISWISPMATSLLTREVGHLVSVKTPGGIKEYEIISITYLPLD